jgi:hypothetical protein
LFNLFILFLYLKTISCTELISNINVTQSSKFNRTTEMFMTDSVFLFFQLSVLNLLRRSVPMLGLNHWTPLINTRNKIENYSYHNHTTILHVCTYLFIRIKISRYGFTFNRMLFSNLQFRTRGPQRVNVYTIFKTKSNPGGFKIFNRRNRIHCCNLPNLHFTLITKSLTTSVYLIGTLCQHTCTLN